MAFASTILVGRTKFDKRATKAIFLGFKPGTKGYILYDLSSKIIFISRNVVFYETHFPYDTLHSNTQDTNTTVEQFDCIIPLQNFVSPMHDNSSIPLQQHDIVNIEFASHDFIQPTEHDIINIGSASHDSDELTECVSRVSTRSKKPPHYLADYHCPTISSSNVTSSTPYPLHSYLSYSNCSQSHTTFCLSLSGTYEPTSFKEANQIDCWQRVMKAELDALERNKTWSLVPLPPGKKVVNCRWVYRTKFRADGSIERYKARLVAKGFTQTEGIDFFETFSPVVKLTTVRFLLSVAISCGWFLHQLDIDNAFLNGDLDEEVYMRPPPSLLHSSTNLVCKLHKSLYGLRQASRQWNAKLTSALLHFGFTQSSADHSLFVQKTPAAFTALLIYVDDIVIAGKNIQTIAHIKSYLNDHFHIKDLGELKYFLGLEIARSQRGLVINQRKYCLDIISDFGLTGCKPVPSPANPSVKLTTTDGELVSDPTIFRKLIGKLLYLTHTRPDISFAVQQVSQFMIAPRTSHLQAASASSNISKMLLARVCFILLITLIDFKLFPIQTGLPAAQHANQSPVIVFSMATA